jgi:hypothetical protein
MKTLLLKHWSFFRLVRLLTGVLIAGQGLYSSDGLLTTAGIALTALALFNVSCCASGACDMHAPVSAKDLKEVDYEEVV